jgi:hypothetical protein
MRCVRAVAGPGSVQSGVERGRLVAPLSRLGAGFSVVGRVFWVPPIRWVVRGCGVGEGIGRGWRRRLVRVGREMIRVLVLGLALRVLEKVARSVFVLVER